MTVIDGLLHALSLTASMAWSILWALGFWFLLSSIVQAVVRRDTDSSMLGDDRPRSLAAATGFGMASSSCSYAAVALARSLFRKGAGFSAAMAFEIASTNLVIELGVIMALLLGWQFTLAESVGGPIIIVFVALLFRVVLNRRLIDAAARQADRGRAGSMEGHAAMDMSVSGEGGFRARLVSADGATAVSHVFVMEWAAIYRDLVAGLLIAGRSERGFRMRSGRACSSRAVRCCRRFGGRWSDRSWRSSPVCVRSAMRRWRWCCGLVASASAV